MNLHVLKILLVYLIILVTSQYRLTEQIRQKLLTKANQMIDDYIQQPKFMLLFKDIQVNPICSTCHAIVKGIQNVPAKQIVKGLQVIAVEYCVLTKIQERQVCKGAIGEQAKYLLQSLWKKVMDPHSLCPKMKLCSKQYEILKSQDYIKNILKDKIEKAQEQPTLRKILNVAHVSDIHPDFFYVPGTPTTCNQPLCCRNGVIGKPNSKLAGYWGSNEGDCDLPFQTFNLMLNQLKDMSIDAIVWTGDNTAHDIWKQSQSYNANFTRIIADRFYQVLPKAVVLPAIGNHECFPVNIYEWDKQQNLNTHLGMAWQRWIGTDGLNMMKKNGYFSFRIQQYKLIVLSLNTQAWSHQNFILLENPTDPGNQLQWMQNILRKAEQDEDFVYILGHIPPNDGLNQYSQRYNALVNRFSYTIRGQFYGHTHSDHISFFNKINSSQILNHCLIAPSLTTASNKNPNYRIMKVDMDTMRVLDYDQYALKLQRNYSKTDVPKFQITYSLLKQYNMQNFDFPEIKKFKQKLKTDPQTQIKYIFHRDGDLKPGKPDPKVYCDTFGSEKQVIQCQQGKLILNTFEKATGPWKKLIE